MYGLVCGVLCGFLVCCIECECGFDVIVVCGEFFYYLFDVE